jgi:acylpyruvate hydrolase
MKLATIRTTTGTAAVRVDGDAVVESGHADVGALLSEPAWREKAAAAAGPVHDLAGAEFAPLILRPGKVVCVGLNYRNHILEMGRQLPEFPTLFAKYPEALVGAHDDIALAPESGQVDWEAELAVVIGARVRRAPREVAEDAIAGFAVLNDVTMRDWQYRTAMWDQGKTWEATTPFGPFLVTPDELPGGVRPVLDLQGSVNGELVQRASTGDLVFDPVTLVEYVSTILTLQPGDVIASGTPGGVGHARKPARYLADGDVLTTMIAGLGTAQNRAVAEKIAGR